MTSQIDEKAYACIFKIYDGDTFEQLCDRYESVLGKAERLIFVDLRTLPALSLDDLLDDIYKEYDRRHAKKPKEPKTPTYKI